MSTRIILIISPINTRVISELQSMYYIYCNQFWTDKMVLKYTNTKNTSSLETEDVIVILDILSYRVGNIPSSQTLTIDKVIHD